MLKRVFTLALATLVLAGCGKKNAATPSSHGKTASQTARQVLNLGNGAEPQDIDPQAITGEPDIKVAGALFEGLASEDPKDLHPVPGLAKSWDISADGTVYTFHLRENARWSNGDPITVDDYLGSYQRMLTPSFAAEYAYMLYDYIQGAREFYDGKTTDFATVGVKALGPYTLQVTLKHSTPYLLKIIASHCAWTPVPVKVLARHGALTRKSTPWTRPENIVSSGPFILKEWRPGQRIVVVRNPNYWDASAVKLDEIHFHPIDHQSTEEKMFRTGQLDITLELPQGKIDTYRKEYPASLQTNELLTIYFYTFNVTRPPLNDKRVRRALALAIDRESLVKNVTRGGQRPAYALNFGGIAGYSPAAHLSGTLAEAKRLLAEAGYPDGKNCPVIELLYNTSENHRAIAEAVQAMWRKNLGVEIRLVNQEWKVFLDMVHTKNFSMARYSWGADYVDPHAFLEIWPSDSGNNNTNWANPEFDSLLKQALAARTEQERFGIYQKMDAILVDELPAIPIYYYTRPRAVNQKVKGFYPTPLDHHPYKYIYLEN